VDEEAEEKEAARGETDREEVRLVY